jgi:very-short-patch-repair endonuclease
MENNKNKYLQFAKILRKNLAPQEVKLWQHLRNNQLKVKIKRQHIIGNYIVDFVCLSKKIIIEIDGSQHFNNKNDDNRTKYLTSLGFKVIRFYNNEVNNTFEAVLEEIYKNLQ